MTYDATAHLNYSFDQENRITGANGYTYTYDADGNRVRKSNGTLAANGTLYWNMTPGIVAESDLAGTTTSEYVFFGGERVARRDGVNGAGGVFYYFSDHLKTASVITDSAGNIKAESDYYPWGGELQFTNNDSNHYKFTGKERDTETGLDYFGARYYSNGLGRWVSADWSPTPIPVPYADFGDPQSLNLYGYVKNVPTINTDADGHCPECLGALFGAAGGAIVILYKTGQAMAGHGSIPTNKEIANTLVKGALIGATLGGSLGEEHDQRQPQQQPAPSNPQPSQQAAPATEQPQTTYQTYTKTNPETGQTYSGRTSGTGTSEENVAARDGSHHMNEKGYGPAQLDKSSTNPDAIRGREQQLIDANGGAQSQGGTSGNAINGISPNNPNRQKYLDAADKEFGPAKKPD